MQIFFFQNIRVMANYYTRMHLSRMAELLDLTDAVSYNDYEIERFYETHGNKIAEEYYRQNLDVFLNCWNDKIDFSQVSCWNLFKHSKCVCDGKWLLMFNWV